MCFRSVLTTEAPTAARWCSKHQDVAAPARPGSPASEVRAAHDGAGARAGDAEPAVAPRQALPRPAPETRGHTGYLTFARRLVAQGARAAAEAATPAALEPDGGLVEAAGGATGEGVPIPE
jgi:hypothetical protein